MRYFATSTPRPDAALHLRRGLVVLGLAALATPVTAAPQAPDPPDGRWAVTTVAVLHHQKNTCDILAGKILEHWRELGPVTSHDIDEGRIREHVLQTQLSDLAASRSAGDLVARFLPRARSETNSETVASLRRLDTLTTELCNAVALPVAPVGQFEAKIREILDRLEVEQAELGRLLVVSDEDEQAALEPYLIPIQVAGIEAEGEYLAYLESLKPKPKEPTIQDRMRAWHAQVYVPAVTPVKKTFGAFIAAQRTNNGREMNASCRALTRDVTALLRNDAAFESPDPRLEVPLRNVYVAMRRLATQCTAGRSREVQNELAEIQRRLRDSGEVLKRYQLPP